jgi:hypothetical protein
MATASVDSSALRIHLNELKSEFDNAMRNGEDFSKVKTMYQAIKEVEWHLRVMEWEKSPHSARSAPYSEGRPYL